MSQISGQERGQRGEQVLNSLADRWDTPMVRDDRAIGKLWAELANGACRFVMGKDRGCRRFRLPRNNNRAGVCLCLFFTGSAGHVSPRFFHAVFCRISESVRSEAPNALWSPEAKPLAGRGCDGVAQPPSCHEELASYSEKEHIICDEQMERFVRHVFRNHSGKSCVRDKKKAALPGGIPWSRRVWKTGQRGKAFQSCWLVFSSVMFWSESLLTRAKMSADRQTVVRGPSFMGWG